MDKPESTLQRIFKDIANSETVSVALLARDLGIQPESLIEKLRPSVKSGLLVFADGRAKVAINPGFGHVVGIDLGGSHLHFALANFRGEILQSSKVIIRPEDGPRRLIEQITEGTRGLAKQVGGRLRAVAIGVPSPVDAERGVVAFANNLPGWTNIHLAHELKEKLRVPIFLENDADMAAIGEHWQGAAQGVKDFVFIAIGTGIGAGVFVNGKLHRGRTGSAGELYRMNLDWHRWADDFGDTGYLEYYVSGMGIATEARKALKNRPGSGASDLARERDAYFVFEALRKGDPDAHAVLKRVFTMLGVCISNIIAILDPDLIVLGGGIVKGAPEFMLSTVGEVIQRIQKGNAPPVKLSVLEDKAQTFGAVHSALAVGYETVARRL